MIQFMYVLFLPKASFIYVVTIPYDVTETRLKYLPDRSYDLLARSGRYVHVYLQ